MIRNFFLPLLVFVLILSCCQTVQADDPQEAFTRYMLEWREKSSIAQDYLRKGEQELKTGVKYRACLNQRLASKYGVEAFQALIQAQQYSETDKELVNLEDNLSEWKKLGRCSTAGSLFN